MRRYAVWGLLAAVSIVFMFLPPDWLRYDRAALAAGEWWRFFTGHLCHLSWAHLGLNLAALALTAYVAGPARQYRQQCLLWLWLFAYTGAGLFLIAPDLLFYVGLSGALHGALIVFIADSPYYPRHVRWIVIAVVCGKILWEQSPWFDDMANAGMIGGRTETRAHLLGGIAGLLWVGGEYIWRRYEQRR